MRHQPRLSREKECQERSVVGGIVVVGDGVADAAPHEQLLEHLVH